MKKLVAFLLILGLIGGYAAMAQTTEEPVIALPDAFMASYRIERSLRAEPWANSELVCLIPKGSRIFLTPVNAEYAATAYEGKAGYIFYGDAVADEGVMMDSVAPYYAVTTQTEYVYDAPHFSANILEVYADECALWVQGHMGAFAVLDAGGESRYIPLKSIAPIKPDAAVTADEAYMNDADVLLLAPVAGAVALGVVPMGQKVTWYATNGLYAAISYEDQAGYVLKAKLVKGLKEQKQRSIVRVTTSAVTYSAPNKYAFTADFLPRDMLVCVDSVSGSYSHIEDLNVYILSSCLTPVGQAPLNAFYGYWEDDQPLYLKYGEKPILAEVTVLRHTPIEISINATGGYYLVKADGQWGYIQKEGMKVLKEQKLKNIQATIALKGTEVLKAPFSDAPVLLALSEDMPIWLTHTLEGYAALGDGYVDVNALKIVGENKEIRTYEAYIEKDIALYDFPSVLIGAKIADVRGNSLVKISVLNGDYAYISFDGMKGYVPLESAVALDRLFDTDNGKRYVIYLNKQKYELSVYEADAQFNRLGEPLRTAVIAIGKRTTPTPAGEFDLGARERWHYFGPSFAPFAIKYAPGRYLHGPLYYSANENALNKDRLRDFGTMATGGCLRMPYEDILFIYCHCNENNSKIVIVNGEEQK